MTYLPGKAYFILFLLGCSSSREYKKCRVRKAKGKFYYLVVE